VTLNAFGLIVFFTFALATHTGYCLTTPFGKDDFDRAGEGCVAGFVSGYGRTAYYQGDTDQLNKRLQMLDRDSSHSANLKLRLHVHSHAIAPLDPPLIPIANDVPDAPRLKQSIPVDWSIWQGRDPIRNRWRRAKPFGTRIVILRTGIENSPQITIPYRPEYELDIVVNVWDGESIDLALIDIPDSFTIECVAKSAVETAADDVDRSP
jgi:hypothetical protein